MKLFTIIALALFLFIGCSAASEPFAIPALKERPASLAGTDFERLQRSYDELKMKYTRDTNDITSLVKIAQVFVLEARATGEEKYYYSSATSLLDRVLMRDPDHFEALVTKGTILLTYHRFKEALAVAERAHAVSKGGSAFVYGLLVDANVELGNYDAAVKYSDAMIALRPDLRSYSRASYLRELHGDVQGAKQAMKMAAESGMFGEEDRAWAFNQLAKLYEEDGALDTAAYIFGGVLEERPSYVPAMVGRANVWSIKGSHKEAVTEIARALQMSRTHEVIEVGAEIHAAAGDHAKATTLENEAKATFLQQEKDGWNIDREFAEFCLSHEIEPAEALKRAERDHKNRPANIHSNEIYGWALAVNGRAKEAIPYLEAALRLGMRDLGMYQNAATIYHLAEMNEKAREMLNKLVVYERCLDHAGRAEARELAALLGDKN